MKRTIISLDNDIEWNGVVAKSFSYDFYHCNSYHKLDCSGEPFLFVAEHQGEHIAIPLIKRSIEGSIYYDCTSVYGYAGPIVSGEKQHLNTDLIVFFQEELDRYFQEQDIIAVFSRLHPILDQNAFLLGYGDVVALNNTISIDLELPIEIQRQQFRKSNKSELSQLRRKGFTVGVATKIEEINEFIKIYNETMQRVNASAMYFFTDDYFYNFLNSQDFNAELLLAYKDSEIVAGAIFTTTKDIMQYHLAGTKSEFMKETPMKLIIDEARLLGSNRALRRLHLGGGISMQDDDPLYRFKSGFSDLNHKFYIWKYIVNQKEYDQLVMEKSQNKTLNNDYFPLYRG